MKKVFSEEQKNTFGAGLLLIVKPSREGSSVGMTKVVEENVYRVLSLAFQHDDEILIGEMAAVRIYGGDSWRRNLPSIRIQPAGTFYDYEAKYLLMRLSISAPAGLEASRESRATVPRLSCRHGKL
ncbi:hypothetical protein KCP78_24770 [Salmonella enterica subsp. enterica]|nr:hypothetical protein KCP78_24770 [Salmonella enterica subsp. enterica]